MWVSANRLGSLPAPDGGRGLIWLKCQMVLRNHRASFANLGSTVHGVVLTFFVMEASGDRTRHAQKAAKPHPAAPHRLAAHGIVRETRQEA